MESLEAELAAARTLTIAELADAIQSIGFECARCGACCKADDDGDHVATIFPDEVRTIEDRSDAYDWRDVARPVPFGLDEDGTGETFEWALQVDDCGDCTFYDESDGIGACTIYADRPLICRTYPFSIALDGTSQPMGEAVERDGVVRAHECEGLGRDISRADAEQLARELKRRAVRELKEALAVTDAYDPVDPESDAVVVHDSEGAKHPDGTPLDLEADARDDLDPDLDSDSTARSHPDADGDGDPES